MIGMTAGAMAFQLLVWLIPNVIGDAVAVAILGLLLGPVYPCAQTIFAKLLPRNVQMTAVGFIASAGSSGSAVAWFAGASCGDLCIASCLHWTLCSHAYLLVRVAQGQRADGGRC